MKRISLLISFLLLFLSCKLTSRPTFLGVQDVKFISIDTDSIKLQAKALFKNENHIGGEILTEDVNVLINEKPIAILSSEKFKVPARKEFEVPLIVAVPNRKIFSNNLLEGLLNTFVKTQSIKVQFKGNIKYKVLGFSNNYPLNKTKELKLN